MAALQSRGKFIGLTSGQWFWLLVIIPGVPFACGSLFLVGYSNIPWPIGDEVTLGVVRDDSEELIVLVHGKGDSPSSWADGFVEELEAGVLDVRQQAVTVDWGKYSGDLFRSTLNARRIGHDLGKKILAHKNIQRLHLVGHSAGSFVIFGLCEAYKEGRGKAFVQTTYLDPVSIYGGVDWGFGSRNFGSCADISDAYIDHDDGVPGSNKPMKHPHTFDVTALKKMMGYSGSAHLWPIEYYRRSVVGNALPYWKPEKSVLLKYPQKMDTLL